MNKSYRVTYKLMTEILITCLSLGLATKLHEVRMFSPVVFAITFLMLSLVLSNNKHSKTF